MNALKSNFWLLGIALMAAATMNFSSCKDDENGVDTPDNPTGRIDSLVCRDKHHFFRAKAVSCTTDIQCAENIILYCIVCTLLHERHMFVRCSMKDQLRAEGFEDAYHALFVAD